ncbi:MAG: formylglycine-generating enzyme family protein, partial [Paludibacteraceae bacterium]|nr:formylglycine-generating enzyme family protein [Paludibacteraceae bacterium]
TGVYRVTRGGSAMLPSRMNRVSYRDGYAVGEAFADLGFRLVKVENELENIPVKEVEINMKDPTLRFEVRDVSFTMVKVPSGSFVMGATAEQGMETYDWEKPKHYVTVGDYYIGRTEVTQALWKAVMDSVPSIFQNDLTNPVENVSWEDCQLFIKRLNMLTGATFRLPTEAEWEYAARGGASSKNTKCAGNDKPADVAWYKANSLNSTHPVGLKSPNELGLYDMNGNVWEWCQDRFGYYESASQINPTGPEEGADNQRVIRGGSWAYDIMNCRISVRHGQEATVRKMDIGFRLAL